MTRAGRLLLAMMAALLALPAVASAADFHGGKDRIVITGDVYVDRGEKVDTIFVVDGDVTIRGTVHDNVINITGHTRVFGHVEGDVISITDRAHIERGGRVDGDVSYVEEKPVVAPGATVGDVRHLKAGEWGSPATVFIAAAALWLAMSLSSLVLGLVLLWLVPRGADEAFMAAGRYTGQSIAAGLGLVVGLPVVALLLLATLVGIPLGLTLLLALLPLAAIGYATSAWLLGRAIVKPPRGRMVSFLAGWGILRAVALIPLLGGLVWLGAAVFGLGTLAVVAWRARSASPDAPSPGAPPPGAPPAEQAPAPA